ncbi:MAG: 16S rRNA (guanine(527)-N(7))-methyltransferase RsmG [Chloroflexi bacterium]|nr:16S rRNA (guanine(527)-N(7))-methyltransferase RsmG [Chloroflexota bacterium]
MEELAKGALKFGVALSPQQLAQFEVYYRKLETWNQRVNLTSIQGYREVQVGHFLDSLSICLALRDGPWGLGLEQAPPQEQGTFSLIDVGTGAGLPALPLKIAFPHLRVTLVDSVAKKTAFLTHLLAALGLNDVSVKTERAETLARHPDHRESYDLAVSRAVASLPTLLELSLPFLRVGGVMVAPKKGAVAAEVARAGRALTLLGGRVHHVTELTLAGEKRALVVVAKVSPVPEAYPRRPGLPKKRPL